MNPRAHAALERLVADGLVETTPERGPSTTKRWQGAFMRATRQLLAEGEDGEDLRVPIARALFELYPTADDAELVALVTAIFPIAARELSPAPPQPPR